MGAVDELEVVADEVEVGSGVDGGDGGLLDGGAVEDAAHFKIVGDDEAVVANLLAEDGGDPLGGDGGGSGVSCDLGEGGVGNHDERERAGEETVGEEIVLPERFETLLDDGESVVGVELAFAESGEMFAAAGDVSVLESEEEGAGVGGGGLGIGGDGAGGEDGERGFETEVEDGCEIDIEAEGADFSADDLSVGAVEGAEIALDDILHGGCGGDDVLEAIDGAAFHIDTAEERDRGELLRGAEKGVSLARRFYVAGKEDDAAGLEGFERVAEGGGEFQTIEAEGEELSGEGAEIVRGGGHNAGL